MEKDEGKRVIAVIVAIVERRPFKIRKILVLRSKAWQSKCSKVFGSR